MTTAALSDCPTLVSLEELMPGVHETTRILHAVRDGDVAAAEQLLPVVYDELRALAGGIFRAQPSGHTLQPTALVHEAWMRLVDQTSAQWRDRAHFFAVAARAMRQILIDHARRRNAAKRGGGARRMTIDEPEAPDVLGRLDVLALDEALDRLEAIDERQARVVEMRFFGGLTVEETAAVLDVSPRTIELDWKMAKAWLSREMAGQDDRPS